MAMDKDDVVDTLNDLIETCKDGEEGFRTCAEDIKNADLKSMFTTAAQRCAQAASELQMEVQRLGGKPEKSGSLSGSAHRRWVDIKSAITGKDDHAIVAEAERGEDVAKSAYENALKEALPGTAQTLVQQQSVKVRQAHDHVRDLRDREKVTH